MSMSEHDNNEFEKYPLLATWMERLANSNIEGMSLSEWARFCEAVNSAIKSASYLGTSANRPKPKTAPAKRRKRQAKKALNAVAEVQLRNFANRPLR